MTDQSPAAPDDQPVLFDVNNDELLISVYHKHGRTLDDLPYTEEFESIHAAAGDGCSRGDLFHRLHNLRKAGRLPRLGKARSSAPRIADEHESLLAALVEEAIGKLSLRDQLLYTDTFDALVVRFNSEADLNLSPHDCWRIVAKLAK